MAMCVYAECKEQCVLILRKNGNRFALIKNNKIEIQFDNISNLQRIFAFTIIRKLLLIYGIHNNKHIVEAYTIGANDNGVEMKKIYHCDIAGLCVDEYMIKGYCCITNEWILLFEGDNKNPMMVRFKIIIDNGTSDDDNPEIHNLQHALCAMNIYEKNQHIHKVTTDGDNLLFILLSKFKLYIHNVKKNQSYQIAEPIRPNPWIGKLMSKRIYLISKNLVCGYNQSLVIYGYVRNFEKKHNNNNIPCYLTDIIVQYYGIDFFLFIGYNEKRSENMRIAFAGLIRCSGSHITFNSKIKGLEY